jgi:PTH1 family peptidyl-tRNA hydrolase
MNELGAPLAAFMHKNGIKPSDLLVIHDELDLPFGVVKMGTPGSSSAGHKGLESIIRELGSRDFHRIRFGIQTPEQSSRQISAEDFVLRHFSSDEEPKLPELIAQAAELALQWSK